jgi:hypothetical protein
MILEAVPAVIAAQRERLGRGNELALALRQLQRPAASPGALELAWLDETRVLPVLALLQDDAQAAHVPDAALAAHLRTRLDALADALDRSLAGLGAEPRRARGFAPALTATRRMLAVAHASLLDALVDEGEAPEPELAHLGRVVQRWSRAAYLRTVCAEASSPRPTAPELVRFRVESMREAGNEVRAQALAADAPDRVELARQIARRGSDPVAALDSFSRAVEAARRAELEAQGPRRRFRAMHLVLALILVAFTVWHYWLR